MYGGKVTYSKELLYKNFQEAVEISEINLSVIKIGGDILMYPRGEKVLDKELVEEVFSFLNEESQQHCIAAVKSYRQSSYIKSAESIRRCIEEFLRFKLKNSKGLDGNLKELSTQLKELKVSSQIKTIIHQSLTLLDTYFNEHSKHNDGEIGEAENEFLLYQSGLLMRYINKVL